MYGHSMNVYYKIKESISLDKFVTNFGIFSLTLKYNHLLILSVKLDLTVYISIR